jgi:hypothetical protein
MKTPRALPPGSRGASCDTVANRDDFRMRDRPLPDSDGACGHDQPRWAQGRRVLVPEVLAVGLIFSWSSLRVGR